MLRLKVATGLFIAAFAGQACTKSEATTVEPIDQDGALAPANHTEGAPANNAAADEAAPAAEEDSLPPDSDEASSLSKDDEAAAALPEASTDDERDLSPPLPAAANAAAGTSGGQLVVTASALNVRSGPGMKHRIMRVLKRGTMVTALETSERWIKIGEGEYLSLKYVKAGQAASDLPTPPASQPPKQVYEELPSPVEEGDDESPPSFESDDDGPSAQAPEAFSSPMDDLGAQFEVD